MLNSLRISNLILTLGIVTQFQFGENGVTVMAGIFNRKPFTEYIREAIIHELNNPNDQNTLDYSFVGNIIVDKKNVFTYAPGVFRGLHQTYGISIEEYKVSLKQKLIESFKSSAQLFFTNDQRFAFKIINEKELKFLIDKVLPKYVEHFKRGQLSLLSQIVGVYKYKNNILLVTKNVLGIERHEEQFNLKGSTVDRTAKGKELKKSPFEIMYRDLDFMHNHPNGISIDTPLYQSLVDAVDRDTNMLHEINVTDYSLLLGFRKNLPGGGTTAAATRVSANGGYFGNIEFDDGTKKGRNRQFFRSNIIFHLGIVDFLTEMDLAKTIGVAVKMPLQGPGMDIRGSETYKNRFYNFFTCTVVHSDGYTACVYKSSNTNDKLTDRVQKQFSPKKHAINTNITPFISPNQSMPNLSQSNGNHDAGRSSYHPPNTGMPYHAAQESQSASDLPH